MLKRLSSFLWVLLILTACNTARLSVGIAQYEQGEYYNASQTLKKVYKQTDAKQERADKAKTAYYMGLCYDRLMIPSQALSSLQNALRFGYDTAVVTPLIERLKRQAKADVSRYEVKKFTLTNTRRADFSPAIWGENDEILYWTSSSDKSTGEEHSPITGTKYCDLWNSSRDEQGKWNKPSLIEGGINTAADEGTPCFSPDGNTMYYTAAGGGEGRTAVPHIYVSQRNDAAWSAGTLLEIVNDTLSTFAHPAVSPDGKYIYFVSNLPGGQGGMDLWRATLTEATSVGAIENLGEAINTPGREMFPTFSPDGILYFSTDGRESVGGLDIYSAREDEWGTWHVEHLGAPINSTADDFGMTFCRSTKEQQEGWFSSNRQQPKGYDNLYTFRLPSIKIRITGTVFDAEEEPLGEAIVRVVGRNGMNYKTLTKPDGSYTVDIDRSTEYVMMAGKKNYLNRKAQFTSDKEEEDADYEVDFYLPSIEEPVLVDNIFYDYNQAQLREESYPSLDDLVQLLVENPYTAIELAAHTDRVGSQEFNLDLSQRRAQSVVNYLISQGIDAGRLSPVGYGKAQPKTVDEKLHSQYEYLPIGQVLDEEFISTLEPEQQQIADQINRRTEFQVTDTMWGIR